MSEQKRVYILSKSVGSGRSLGSGTASLEYGSLREGGDSPLDLGGKCTIDWELQGVGLVVDRISSELRRASLSVWNGAFSCNRVFAGRQSVDSSGIDFGLICGTGFKEAENVCSKVLSLNASQNTLESNLGFGIHNTELLDRGCIKESSVLQEVKSGCSGILDRSFDNSMADLSQSHLQSSSAFKNGCIGESGKGGNLGELAPRDSKGKASNQCSIYYRTMKPR
jgi:hypothetical protein